MELPKWLGSWALGGVGAMVEVDSPEVSVVVDQVRGELVVPEPRIALNATALAVVRERIKHLSIGASMTFKRWSK